jgi:hypothetical protein
MSIENTIGMQVYIIDMLGYVRGCLIILSGIFATSSLTAGFIDGINIGPSRRKFIMKVTWCGLACLALSVVIPSQKALYLIMSDGIVREVNQRKIPEKALEILDRKLDEYLKENK